jgi:hypothetical protein
LIQVYEEAFQGFNVALALLDGSSAQHEAVLADVEELWESYAHDTHDTWHTRHHDTHAHDIARI